MNTSGIVVRVIVLGGAKVGKTSILRRCLEDEFSPRYQSTVEDVFHKKVEIGEQMYEVEFLDTAGSYEFPAMRRLAMNKATAFVLVFSLVDESSLAVARELLEQIREEREDMFREAGWPLVVAAAHKADLVPATYPTALDLEAEDWFTECGLPSASLVRTSAKDEDGNCWKLFFRLWEVYRLNRSTSSFRNISSDSNSEVLEDCAFETVIGSSGSQSSTHKHSCCSSTSNQSSSRADSLTTPLAASDLLSRQLQTTMKLTSGTDSNDYSKRRFSAFAILSDDHPRGKSPVMRMRSTQQNNQSPVSARQSQRSSGVGQSLTSTSSLAESPRKYVASPFFRHSSRHPRSSGWFMSRCQRAHPSNIQNNKPSSSSYQSRTHPKDEIMKPECIIS